MMLSVTLSMTGAEKRLCADLVFAGGGEESLELWGHGSAGKVGFSHTCFYAWFTVAPQGGIFMKMCPFL